MGVFYSVLEKCVCVEAGLEGSDSAEITHTHTHAGSLARSSKSKLLTDVLPPLSSPAELSQKSQSPQSDI